MTISKVISNVEEQNEEVLIFARKINGKFLSSSEAILVELAEEEQGSPTNEVARKHCPGFDYFLEIFLVKDMLQDLSKIVGYKSLEQQIDRVIHYAESDA